MLRKNLSNGARKILDSSNLRLAKILNSEFLFQTLQKNEAKQRNSKTKIKSKQQEIE
jgi:hypothetical protein